MDNNDRPDSSNYNDQSLGSINLRGREVARPQDRANQSSSNSSDLRQGRPDNDDENTSTTSTSSDAQSTADRQGSPATNLGISSDAARSQTANADAPERNSPRESTRHHHGDVTHPGEGASAVRATGITSSTRLPLPNSMADPQFTDLVHMLEQVCNAQGVTLAEALATKPSENRNNRAITSHVTVLEKQRTDESKDGRIQRAFRAVSAINKDTTLRQVKDWIRNLDLEMQHYSSDKMFIDCALLTMSGDWREAAEGALRAPKGKRARTTALAQENLYLKDRHTDTPAGEVPVPSADWSPVWAIVRDALLKDLTRHWFRTQARIYGDSKLQQ